MVLSISHSVAHRRDTDPKTMQNGNISKRTEAPIGRCFSSRVMARDAKVKARLSKVRLNVTWTVSKSTSSRTSSILISL